MRRRLSTHERELDRTALAKGNSNRRRAAPRPVLISNSKRWCRSTGKHIRWLEDLDSGLLEQTGGLWVRAGDQDGAVLQENRLGVVVSVDRAVGEQRHAPADGLGWVVEDRVVVCVGGETEARYTFFGAVDDEVSSVRKRCHAGHYTLGRLDGIVSSRP